MSIPRMKLSPACDFCRLKKVRCVGGCPCSQCLVHGESCSFTARRRPQRKPKQSQELLVQRLSRLETLLNEKITNTDTILPPRNPPSTFDNATQGSDSVAGRNHQPLVGEHSGSTLHHVSEPQQTSPLHDGHSQVLEESSALGNDTPQSQGQLFARGSHFSSQGNSELFYDHENIPNTTREASSVIPNEISHWEYNGPRCIMSIYSAPGLAWLKDKCGLPEIERSVTQFARDTMRRLKIGPSVSRARSAEPSEEEAWVLASAYFNSAQEACFGIVRRPWFEDKLRAHFSKPPEERHDDMSWYALRNTIYAFGSRFEVSKKDSFSQAVDQSMVWFENALAVHGDLLCLYSTLVGVHALTLMACFAEGIGTPHLSYALGSSAMRLAISKGLHRQPAATWNLSHQEIIHRNWTFWALYCIDRQHACRSGRPLGISDDEISCHLPETCPVGMSMNVNYFTLFVKICQMSSRAMKGLSSAQALRQSPEELFKTVSALDTEIRALSLSLEPSGLLHQPTDLEKTHGDFTKSQMLSIHFLYHALVLDVHSALAFPWPYRTSSLARDPEYRQQVERSCELVADSCRTVILATRFVDIDANSPVLTCVFLPVYALAALLIHILKAPNLRSAFSDVVLTETAAGFFARLEFATDLAISFPFLKEVPRFARHAVERANSAVRDADTHMINNQEAMIVAQTPEESVGADVRGFYQECDQFNFDVDLETWSTLFAVPVEEQRDYQPFWA